MHIPPRVGEDENARWVVEEGQAGTKSVSTAGAHASSSTRGAGGGRAERVLGGQGGTAGPLRQCAEAGNAAQKAAKQTLQAITGQVPVRETIMRWYRDKDMDHPEEYMRCHCGRGQETYEHFMQCEQYKGIEEPLGRDQDVLLIKKGATGRSAMERELRKEGHQKGLWPMVIATSLWRALQEHTVAPEAMAHRVLRRMAEHLQERMACRETQLEARAETCVIRSPNKWG